MINATISDYDRFLSSREWHNKRIEIIQRDNCQCQICGRKESLQVHHFCYYDIKMLDDDNLVTLCKLCHEIVSEKVDEINRYTYRELLDRVFLKDFLSNVVLELYIKSYCKNTGKSISFLQLEHLRDKVCDIIRNTFSWQCKVCDKDLQPIVHERIYSLSFINESQGRITEYRKHYIFESLLLGEPPYAIKSYLGIYGNTYYKLVKGDSDEATA